MCTQIRQRTCLLVNTRLHFCNSGIRFVSQEQAQLGLQGLLMLAERSDLVRDHVVACLHLRDFGEQFQMRAWSPSLFLLLALFIPSQRGFANAYG